VPPNAQDTRREYRQKAGFGCKVALPGSPISFSEFRSWPKCIPWENGKRAHSSGHFSDAGTVLLNVRFAPIADVASLTALAFQIAPHVADQPRHLQFLWLVRRLVEAGQHRQVGIR